MELGCFRPWHAAPIHSTYNENDDNNFPFLYVLAFAMACTFADRDAVGDVRWGWGCKKKKTCIAHACHLMVSNLKVWSYY